MPSLCFTNIPFLFAILPITVFGVSVVGIHVISDTNLLVPIIYRNSTLYIYMYMHGVSSIYFRKVSHPECLGQFR